MTHDIWYDDDVGDGGRFVPLYVLVNGRTSPRNTSLDLATQVVALGADSGVLEPEYAAVVTCCGDWMSIAEIAAYLRYPLTVAKILVDVLLERGFLALGTPAEETIRDVELLETILAGLENLVDNKKD
jgi:Protein of unknown function (DUF742)